MVEARPCLGDGGHRRGATRCYRVHISPPESDGARGGCDQIVERIVRLYRRRQRQKILPDYYDCGAGGRDGSTREKVTGRSNYLHGPSRRRVVYRHVLARISVIVNVLPGPYRARGVRLDLQVRVEW